MTAQPDHDAVDTAVEAAEGMPLPTRWTAAGLVPWSPPRPTRHPSRALVLAGGGATGIAWEAGIVAGLREAGIDVGDADLMVGTSAGSVVAAHLRAGTSPEDAFADIRAGRPLGDLGRLGAGDALRFMRAQLGRDRSAGRAVVGRAALRARTGAEDAWVETVSGGLRGHPWPPGRLVITAIDAETGAPVAFDNDSAVPIERAVAASCAVPGVFPPVRIGGRRYIDGGLRSVANVDLAEGYDRVLVLSPIPLALRSSDRPVPQARRLGTRVRSLVIVPDRAAAVAMGVRPLDTSRGRRTEAAGRAQGRREADRVRRVWLG
jgi:NTE family protein